MFIQNSTPGELFYTVSSPGSVDCGTINSGQSQDAGYDNQTNVKVEVSPVTASVFSINIPETGTGKVVTVGMYFE